MIIVWDYEAISKVVTSKNIMNPGTLMKQKSYDNLTKLIKYFNRSLIIDQITWYQNFDRALFRIGWFNALVYL